MSEFASKFFIAVVVILLFCRLVSYLMGKVGQPAVVGEMIAGVLLGPSLLGLISPGTEEFLFPEALRPVLNVAGQIGLVGLMYQAGHEFMTNRPPKAGRTATVVSIAGIVGPLALGVGITFAANGSVNIFKPGVPPFVAALFVGVALAITAFPMLARIITERGISATRHGSIALACGAIDDVVAWILLALVLALSSGRAEPLLVAVIGVVIFGVLMATVVRRLLAWALGTPKLSNEVRLMVTVAVLFAGAWFTGEIGLYAVFGAFCVGMAMPRTETSEKVVETIGPVIRIVFVPLFFTYSGLNTKFGLFTDPALLIFAAVCVVVAIGGKFGGCWAAARALGEPGPVASRIGALMNARGLMQLIALNVGLSAGIVNSELFTVLVLVALITTTMTTWVLSWLDRADLRRGVPLAEPAAVS
ncbi:cation:proton antiporter [Kutzneria sp. 744]|uniref:cation:proton antiporter n=1 Tax=Kutzneria sp. (strain 744) TaxID=345341 RepID=UPI0003EEB519|nr:cation:proton antiporter [Kutzneria sp. 744]EWM12287.1 transporter, monovalent cation:proton antiporter-2 (CPA2) family [Kutzneria sp. 744]